MGQHFDKCCPVIIEFVVRYAVFTPFSEDENTYWKERNEWKITKKKKIYKKNSGICKNKKIIVMKKMID